MTTKLTECISIQYIFVVPELADEDAVLPQHASILPASASQHDVRTVYHTCQQYACEADCYVSDKILCCLRWW